MLKKLFFKINITIILEKVKEEHASGDWANGIKGVWKVELNIFNNNEL